MNNNTLLPLIEHFLYSASVVGIDRSNFNLILYPDSFTVQLSEESDFGNWVIEEHCNSERYYDVEDKQSSQESIDKIEKLYKMFEEYYEIDCRSIV
ncbi:hypothetical protein NVP1063O_208 [Vibrio phage 1.063.O._10N.261.45.C7]|nr:hypothetical protein NVP1063O_208 [Vibrio phage 1.063.O._10N.261.45.C7]